MATKKKKSKGSTKGTVFCELAEHRRRDVRALLEKQRWDAAVYMAWYVIECRLKYAVTVQHKTEQLPEKYETHYLDNLLKIIRVTPGNEATQRLNAAISLLMDQWDPDMSYRYKVGKFDRGKAESFCKLVEDVYGWLKEIRP